MKVTLAVAFGGALGAMSRHVIASQMGHWLGTGFPWTTIAVNLIGSFFLGAVVEVSALAWSPSETIRAFLTVGLLGGFTTFSAFSMDAVLLAERGRLDHAAFYVAGSVVLAIAGIVAGLRLTRLILL